VIKGFATEEGTARYHARLSPTPPAGHVRSWHGLALSSVGLGTYLGSDDRETDQSYRDTVARSLQLGLNVVDSAVNYRHQRSERCIGDALRSLVETGRLARDEVVIATKGGFIPYDGTVPSDPGTYIRETYLRPGILESRDIVAGCHCMAPRFLADQIEKSRTNLNVETIDVYYVHNPEIQLGEIGRPAFLQRIRAAFECLEGAVRDGRIRWYGTATWHGYRQPPTAPDLLSIQDLVETARSIAGPAHHFGVVQLPYNLAMTEAFTQPTQRVGEEAVSLLEAARRLDLYVMTSASIYQGQLARNLPPVVGEYLPGLATDAQRALQFVRSTPGVGTALVGMRHVAHVEENARLTSVAPLPWTEFGKLFAGA
jgi:aryl-alcohol dehydrogenase-like predicted oxidoreductase